MTALDSLPDIPLSAAGMEGIRFGRAPSWRSTLLAEPVCCFMEGPARLTYDGKLVAVAILVPAEGAETAIVLKRVLV
jgi:hypothetical protein